MTEPNQRGERSDEEFSRRPRAPRTSREEKKQKKVPLFFRLCAWGALIVIFVAAGYYGTDEGLKLLDRKEMVNQKDVVSDTAQLQKLLDATSPDDSRLESRKSYDIFSLGTEGLVKGNMKILADTQEDEIAEAVKSVFSNSAEAWTSGIEARHLFRDGVSLYLDLPASFLTGLEGMSEERALLMITGIVRTLVQNFPPVNRVFFLIEGRWVPNVGTIKLSEPWGLGA
ncbi:MAG: GerMN domain-containing protein [Pyramidobacter sp.]|nr:GerMN domain-containing protein [Pyramidobacter sp.]